LPVAVAEDTVDTLITDPANMALETLVVVAQADTGQVQLRYRREQHTQ
jgi:hypothetical protein